MPTNATDKTVTWTTSDSSVATVTSAGVVRGVAYGTATITATSSNGLTATCTVHVVPTPVEGVSLNKDNTTLTILDGNAGSEQLTATIQPNDAANKNVTWTSSNPAVATVSSTGLVTAVGKGTTIITVATEDGGYTATCQVRVRLGKTFLTTKNQISGTGTQTLESSPITLTLNVRDRYANNNYSYVQLNRNNGNIIQVSASAGNTITGIVLNLNNSTSGNLSSSTPTYTSNGTTGTWSGSAQSVNFTQNNNNTRAQIMSVVVYYE